MEVDEYRLAGGIYYKGTTDRFVVVMNIIPQLIVSHTTALFIVGVSLLVMLLLIPTIWR